MKKHSTRKFIQAYFQIRKLKKKENFQNIFFRFLESLTSQSKEKEFEEYCRKIIEATICPNLLPQTGPTGGGDSKVDSETYPVSESIAEGWLYGYNNVAHSERWAFAISAKKDWKPKLKSDVKKIIATNKEHGRGYTRIFFVTNQFVSDKKRAEAEDDLRREYQIDIRILDKTWLLDNTFKNDNQKIAISSFNMSDELNDVIEEGTNDTRRKRRLDEIEKELQNISDLKPARIIKISEESVELLRELEVDKSTIMNALERNIRLAKKYGGLRNYADALYNYCWTIIWWYEDRDKYYEIYVQLENLYKENSKEYPILKDLSTLWITLYANHNQEKKIISDMENHTQLLVKSYSKFIQDNENPKRAKLAKYDYQMMRLQYPELWSGVVETYIEILQDMHFNNDIDLFQLKKLLELPVLKECLKYDELFELLIHLLGEQSQNIESSQLLLNRGDDYIENDIYKSIKFYGRALTKLYHESSKIDLIKTLMKLGGAFEQIGLLWRARSYYIRAFMDSFNLYFNNGNAIPGLFLSARALKYLELRLGYINYSLQLNELELTGLNLYAYKIDDEKEFESYLQYDSLLSVAFLNLEQCNIKRYEALPDYLSGIGLQTSAAALKYNLGYYDDEYVQAIGSKEALDGFMKKLFEQPVSDDFQERLAENSLFEKMELKSKIMGCSIIINAKRDNFHKELGATILALFENMFATSISENIMPMLAEFTIDIEDIESKQFDIELMRSDNTIKIIISNINELTEYVHREVVFKKLNLILAMFTAQMIPLSSEFEKIKKSIEAEEAMFRTLNCSNTLDTFVVYEQDTFLTNNMTKDVKIYKYIREKSVFQHNKVEEKNNEDKEQIKTLHYGELPEGVALSKIHHDKIKISDIIYIPLWDKAKWKGLFVLSDEEFDNTPLVGLVFEEAEGLNIFRKWKEESKTDKISIGIITGIDKNSPYWYRIIIGDGTLDSYTNKDGDFTIINNICRLHTMQAKNDFNIKLLKQAVTKHKTYKFLPVLIKDLETQNLRTELSFIKKIESIIIKDISEIDENDIFLIYGLTPFDIPVNNTGKKLYAERIIQEKLKVQNNHNT